MILLRKFIALMAATSLTGLLVTLVFSIVVFVYFGSAAPVKKMLLSSGVYDRAVNALVQEATKTAKKDSASTPMADQEVSDLASKAFSPELLRSSSEQFIDGLYDWLSGKSPQPTFNIQLSSAKTDFAGSIGSYIGKRYEKLPVCQDGETVSGIDPFNDSCRVEGFNALIISDRVSEEIANDKELLGEPNITAQSFMSKSNPGGTVFEELAFIPKFFKLIKIIPIILGVLILIFCIGVYFSQANRRLGIRKIGVTFIVSGLLVIIGSVIGPILIGLIDGRTSSALGEGALVAQEIVNPIAMAAVRQATGLGLWMGGTYVVMGVVALLSLRRSRRKHEPDAPKATERTPRPVSAADQEIPPAEPALQPAHTTPPELIYNNDQITQISSNDAGLPHDAYRQAPVGYRQPPSYPRQTAPLLRRTSRRPTNSGRSDLVQ